MGQTFTKLFDNLFGSREMRVVMLGLDAAGKVCVGVFAARPLRVCVCLCACVVRARVCANARAAV